MEVTSRNGKNIASPLKTQNPGELLIRYLRESPKRMTPTGTPISPPWRRRDLYGIQERCTDPNRHQHPHLRLRHHERGCKKADRHKQAVSQDKKGQGPVTVRSGRRVSSICCVAEHLRILLGSDFPYQKTDRDRSCRKLGPRPCHLNEPSNRI